MLVLLSSIPICLLDKVGTLVAWLWGTLSKYGIDIRRSADQRQFSLCFFCNVQCIHVNCCPFFFLQTISYWKQITVSWIPKTGKIRVTPSIVVYDILHLILILELVDNKSNLNAQNNGNNRLFVFSYNLFMICSRSCLC